MSIHREIRRRLRPVMAQTLAAAVLAYFGYHAIQGDRGFLAWVSLKQELAKAEAQQAELEAVRNELEHRVYLLRPEHLDPDLLNERARMLLNYVHPEDAVILLNEN